MKKVVGVLLGALLPAAVASAQIQYTIDGPVPVGPTDLLATRIIDVGDLTGGVTTVHIFDSNGVDDSISGQVVIRGSATVFASLHVKVVSQADTATFVDGPREPLGYGLRDFGGLKFENPNDPPGGPYDTSLRDRAVVAVSIQGDITGDIDAAQIWRIDALADAGNNFGGHIDGNITAHQPNDSVLFGGVPSIGYIRAGNRIAGNITAYGARDANGASLFDPAVPATWGNADRIIVGPSATAQGILGNINCEFGAIGQIYCTGPIGGGPAARTQIKAGVRLGRISIKGEFAEATPATVLDRPIYADINSSARGVPSAAGPASSLSLIETNGDFVGRIEMNDFFGFGDDQSISREPYLLGIGGRKGIFVGGDLIGDVDVKYSFQYGDIIARSIRGDATLGFTGSVTIGQMLKGAIVAVGREGSTDPLDGTVASVEIGYGADLTGAPRANQPGFDGARDYINPPPFEGVYRDAWYLDGPSDPHTIGTVIRGARRLGSVHIRAMSNRLMEPNGGLELKRARPRVEAPLIGNLWVDYLDAGVVWSGHLNSDVPFQVSNDISDDYATVDDFDPETSNDLHIGCMGPKADLWVQDTRSVNVDGDMFGEIHLRELNPDQVVRIGGRFGDRAQAEAAVALCSAEYSGSNTFDAMQPYENSPRGVWLDVEQTNQVDNSGVAEHGRILVRTPQRLRGQIILDAYHTTDFTQNADPYWHGDVEVGTGDAADLNLPGTPVVISTNPARATANALGPTYSLDSGPLGGLISCMNTPNEQFLQAGAVGLAPFAFYEADARFIDPTEPMDCGNFRFYPTSITNAQFCQLVINQNGQPTGVRRAGVRLPFYGPVFTTVSSSVSPLKVEWHANALPGQPEVTCSTSTGWVDVSTRCGAMMDHDAEGTLSRHITLWGLRVLSKSQVLPSGHYRVSIATPGSIKSAGMLSPAAVPAVPQFSYCFKLTQATGPADPGSGACVADMDDGSGTGTPDGGVGIDDLLYFLIKFEAGSILVDIDNSDGGGQTDGATDINDLLFFMAHFEAGC